MDVLRISLLGAPLLEHDDRPLGGFTYRKSLALFFYLALTPDAHSRDFLANLLWGNMPDANALAALSRSLSDLRKKVGAYLQITSRTVAFNRSAPYWLDVEHFEPAVRRALGSPDQDEIPQVAQSLREAVDLYRGDLLEGFYVRDSIAFEEAIVIRRERLHLLALQGLQWIVDYEMAMGALHRGIQRASRLLALEPTRETTHVQLMTLFALNGQRSAALRQYESCRDILDKEFGVAPTRETTALHEQILNQAFGQVAPPVSVPIVDWGDAPTLIRLYGRATQLAQVQQWILEQNGRLVAILGMGGQGKTTLAAAFARSYANQFDVVLWRTLLNAPLLTDMLRDWLERLVPESAANIPQSLDNKLDFLFRQLRQKRCLLILDNAESIMAGEQHAGTFRPGYAPYDQLLRRFALSDHQSCLLLTSREKPRQFTQLERRQNSVYSLILPGLETEAGQAILQEEHLSDSAADIATLIAQYSGNPLALIIIADTIHNLYQGDVGAFLAMETAVFENIQVVLAQQFSRLTPLEIHIILWLAVEREAITIATLQELIQLPHTQAELLMGLRSLQRRSLIEKREKGFTLQNVLMEFASDYLVTAVTQELLHGSLNYTAYLPLLRAQTKSYIRRAQERLLLQPVARQLASRGGRTQAIARLKHHLATLPPSIRQGSYAGGNLLNLLLCLDVDEALDFSNTAVWQVNLRGKTLPPINFRGADLTGTAFTEYSGYVLTLGFNPDGTCLAGSTITGELRLWDMASRQPILTIDGHQDFAGGLCFSPDGRFIASGGGDGLACLWDAETGRRLHIFSAHDNAIRPVVYAPDGTWVAGISFNRLTFWDPVSGETLLNQRFATGYVNALAVSPDGTILACNNDHRIQLWDIPATLTAGKGQVLHELEHEHPVRQLLFSPDGRWVASSGQAVGLWETATGKLLRSFTVPHSLIESIAFHPEKSILAGGGKDTIYLWDWETGETRRAFAAHEEMIVSLAFSPDGQILASSSEDHTVRLWNLDGQNLDIIQAYVNMIHSAAVSPDGRYLASASDDHKVRLWDFHSQELITVCLGHQSRVHRAIFSPDGHSLVASSRDKLVRVWDVPTGKERFQLPTSGVPYHALAWSTAGQWLATGDRAGAAMLWESATGHRYQTFRHDTMVCALAFHPDDQRIAVVCFDQKIYIWDVTNGRCLQTLTGHDNEVWALAYSPDGRFLVSGSDDCTVCFWDTTTGECVHILKDHTGWIQTLAFNQGGDLLATGSQDRRAGLWDLTPLDRGEPPRLIRMLTGHRGRVTAVCFTSDDTLIVSSSLDETMRIWEVKTGKCVQKWSIPGPYSGMEITQATGITTVQSKALKSLGAEFVTTGKGFTTPTADSESEQ